MKQEILDYVKTQRVGVLAVEMLDGSPHAATVHFAHTDDPLVFFFETDRAYRKSEPLFGREKTRASVVLGFDESNAKTLQLDGEVWLIRPEEKEWFDTVYWQKFPEKKEKSTANPNAVYFKFTPSWWRFTDWTTPQGKMILTSE